MELDILHRAVAPEIIEFYGAFTIESCVYYCMEYMDAGSLDRMHGDGVPEDVLARITKSIIKGLRFLKDELSVMHRGTYGMRPSVWPALTSNSDRCQANECPGEYQGSGQAM